MAYLFVEIATRQTDQSLYDVTNEMDSMRLSEVDSNLSRLVIRTLLLFRTG